MPTIRFKLLAFAFTSLLAITLLTIPPNPVAAQITPPNAATYTETFEAAAPASIPANTWYQENDNGPVIGGTFSVASATLTGSTKAAQYVTGNGLGVMLATNVDGVNSCLAGQTLDFDLYVPAFSSGQKMWVGVMQHDTPFNELNGYPTNAPHASMGFQLLYASSTTVTVNEFSQRSSTAVATDTNAFATITVPALHHFTLTGNGCITGSRLGAAVDTASYVATIAGGFELQADDFFMVASATGTFYLDNVAWGGVTNPTRHANYETFSDDAPGALIPTGTGYTYTETQDTTPHAQLGVENCQRFPNAQTVGTNYIPDVASKCLIINGGKGQFHSTAGSFCTHKDFSFGIGYTSFVSSGQSIVITLGDAASSPASFIKLTLTGSASLYSAAIQSQITSTHVYTTASSSFVAPIGRSYDVWHFICDATGLPGIGAYSSGQFSVFTEAGAANSGRPNFVGGAPCGGAGCAFPTDTPNVNDQYPWEAFPLPYLTVDATAAGAGGATVILENIDFPIAASINTASSHVNLGSKHLKGFSVDYAGGTVITRQSPGTFAAPSTDVITYGGQTLAANPTTAATYCNITDGVSAIPRFVTYTDCRSSDHAYTNNLEIRSGNLGDPPWPTCGAQKEPTTNTVQLPSDVQKLGRIQGAEWDCLDGFTDSVSARHSVMAWSFTTLNGDVGIFDVLDCSGASSSGGCIDRSGVARQTIDAGHPLGDFCSWRDAGEGQVGFGKTSGKDFVGVVSGNQPYSQWQVATGGDTASQFGGITPTISGSWQQNFNSAPQAIACKQNRVYLLQLDGTLTGMQADAANPCTQPSCPGSTKWTHAYGSTGIVARSLAISEDGEWGVVLVGAVATIFDTTTGATTGTITGLASSNSFFAIAIDANGQNVWVAYDQDIYRYYVIAATTHTPQAFSAVQGSCDVVTGVCTSTMPASTGSTTGLFGNAAGYDLSGSGDPVKGGVVLTIFWVIGMAGLGAYIIPGGNAQSRIWGAGLGAVLGFVMLVAFGNVPPVITFIIILLAAVAVGFKFRASRSGSD